MSMAMGTHATKNSMSCANLVEGNAVVKGEEEPGPGCAEPSEGVAADGEEDEGHVELQRLRGALGGGKAISHHGERRTVAVLRELPGEQPPHGRHPQLHHPRPLPVLPRCQPQPRRRAPRVEPPPSEGCFRPAAGDVLAPPCSTRGAWWPAVVHVRVPLQQQRLQLPQLAKGESERFGASVDTQSKSERKRN